jgi:hypothetical protein
VGEAGRVIEISPDVYVAQIVGLEKRDNFICQLGHLFYPKINAGNFMRYYIDGAKSIYRELIC